MDDTLYDQLERAMVEAENARRCAYQEALKRVKAEREAMDAISRVTVSFSFFFSFFLCPVLYHFSDEYS